MNNHENQDNVEDYRRDSEEVIRRFMKLPSSGSGF